MNKTALLEQRSMVNHLIQKYEDYLHSCIVFDKDGKREAATDALVASPMVKHIYSSKASKQFLSSFLPNRKEEDKPIESVEIPVDQTISQSSSRNSPIEVEQNGFRIPSPLVIPPDRRIAYSDPYQYSTLNRAIESDTVFDGALVFVKDCIPCLERTINDIKNINIGADLSNIFLSDIAARFANIQSFLNLLSNNEILNDLCALMNFLNFMCIPDLMAMFTALTALIAKILDAFKIDINAALWSLISGIFQVALGSLADLLKRYLDILLSPLVCVIDSINFQLTKLPGTQKASIQLQNFKNETLYGSNSVQEDGRLFEDFKGIKPIIKNDVIGNSHPYNPVSEKTIHSDPRNSLISNPFDTKESSRFGLEPPEKRELSIVGTLEGALSFLSYYLASALKYVTDRFMSIEKYIKEILGVDNSALDSASNVFLNVQRLGRLISIIKVFIALKERGSELCSPENQIYSDDVNNIAQEVYGKNLYWNAVAKNDLLYVIPPELARDPKTYEALGINPTGYLLDGKGGSNNGDNGGAEKEPISPNDKPSSSYYTPQIFTKSMESCMKKTSLTEGQNVQRWINDLRLETA